MHGKESLWEFLWEKKVKTPKAKEANTTAESEQTDAGQNYGE